MPWTIAYRVGVLALLVLIYIEARDASSTADAARRHAIAAEDNAAECRRH